MLNHILHALQRCDWGRRRYWNWNDWPPIMTCPLWRMCREFWTKTNAKKLQLLAWNSQCRGSFDVFSTRMATLQSGKSCTVPGSIGVGCRSENKLNEVEILYLCSLQSNKGQGVTFYFQSLFLHYFFLLFLVSRLTTVPALHKFVSVMSNTFLIRYSSERQLARSALIALVFIS